MFTFSNQKDRKVGLKYPLKEKWKFLQFKYGSAFLRTRVHYSLLLTCALAAQRDEILKPKNKVLKKSLNDYYTEAAKDKDSRISTLEVWCHWTKMIGAIW